MFRDGHNYGPFGWDDLWGHYQAGSILGTDLAWYDGMPEWVPVAQLYTPCVVPIATVVAPETAQIGVDSNFQATVGIPITQPIQPNKPMGPLFMPESAKVEPVMTNPSILTVPKNNKSDTKKQNEEKNGKSDKKEGGRLDIQLPRWGKWVVPCILFLITIGWAFRGGESVEVVESDQVLGQAVRNALNKHEGKLEDSDYIKTQELELKGIGLSDLKMLKRCPNLVKLDLSGNRITNLNDLVELTKIEELNLSQNQINDFSPLKRISTIKRLKIDGNPGATKSVVNDLKSALPGLEFF